MLLRTPDPLPVTTPLHSVVGSGHETNMDGLNSVIMADTMASLAPRHKPARRWSGDIRLIPWALLKIHRLLYA